MALANILISDADANVLHTSLITFTPWWWAMHIIYIWSMFCLDFLFGCFYFRDPVSVNERTTFLCHPLFGDFSFDVPGVNRSIDKRFTLEWSYSPRTRFSNNKLHTSLSVYLYVYSHTCNLSELWSGLISYYSSYPEVCRYSYKSQEMTVQLQTTCTMINLPCKRHCCTPI